MIEVSVYVGLEGKPVCQWNDGLVPRVGDKIEVFLTKSSPAMPVKVMEVIIGVHNNDVTSVDVYTE